MFEYFLAGLVLVIAMAVLGWAIAGFVLEWKDQR